MQLDQTPSFRKAITPWYDSAFVCWALIIFLFLVFLFSLFGIYVATEDVAFTPHLWFPEGLAFLSFFLMLKVFFRMRRRSRQD